MIDGIFLYFMVETNGTLSPNCMNMNALRKDIYVNLIFDKSLNWNVQGGAEVTLFSMFCNRNMPGSVVGIATGYGLDVPGIESRWGARFSAPVQTVPGAHPASCAMGTGSFPMVKSGRGVTLTPHPLLVPWS